MRRSARGGVRRRWGAAAGAAALLVPLVVGRAAHSQPVPLALPELTFSSEDRFQLTDAVPLELPREIVLDDRPPPPFQLARIEARRIEGYGRAEAPAPAVGCMNATGFTSWFARGLGDISNTYERAVYLLEDGESEDAEELFGEVVADEPDHPLAADSRFWLGEILAARGDREGALAHFAAAGDARAPGALRDYADYNAGWAAFDLERFDAAHERFAAVARRGTTEALATNARFWDGLALGELGRWAEAAAELRAFTARKDEARRIDDARYLVPVAEFQAGEYNASAGHFTALVRGPLREDLRPLARLGEGLARIRAGLAGPGLASLETFLEQYPTHPRADLALLGAVVATSSLGRTESMRERFEALRAQHPTSPVLDAAYYEIGRHHFNRGEYAKARDVLAEMIQRFPLSGIIDLGYALLAECYMRQGAYAQAALLFAQSRTRSKDPALANQRAHREAIARLYDGETSAAIAVWRELVDREPSAHLSKSAVEAWLGEALVREGQWKLALERFEAVGADDPLHPRSVFQVGYCRFQLGDWEGARKAFGDYLARWPYREEAGAAELGLGEALFNLREYEEARKYLRRAETHLKSTQGRQRAILGLGISFYKDERFADAIAALRRVEALGTNTLEAQKAMEWIGRTQARQGNYRAAIRTEREFLRRFPESERTPDVLLALGDGYYNLGEYAQASRHYEEVEKRYPDSEAAGDAVYAIALSLLKQGDAEGFVRTVSTFVRERPEHPSAPILTFRVAEFFLQEGRLAEAAASLGGLVDRYPKHALADKALLRVGEIELERGRHDEARAALDRLLAEYPESPLVPRALLAQARSRRAHGNVKTEMELYDRIIRDYPDSSEAMEARVGYAGALVAQGRGNEAREMLADCVDKYPDLAGECLYVVGQAWSADKKPQEALTAFREARKRGSRRTAAQSLIGAGRALEGLGRLEEAEQEYIKAVYLYPQEKDVVVQALIRAGRLMEERGQKADAAQVYRKIVANPEAGKYREVAEDRLKAMGL